MVKYPTKTLLPFILFAAFSLFGGCNIDFFGFFASSDLDERLMERDNFRFLTSSDRTLTLGSNYKFIVLTDTHIEDGNSWGLDKMAGVISADPSIKFVVILGDITQYGAARDIDTFINFANSLTIPCYPVIGNHDIYFNNWHIWRDKIGSTNYKIEGDTASLFVLDSANAFFGKDQLDRLEREVKSAAGRVFVFTHAPLFVTGPLDMQQITDTKERARIISILRNKCDIMFMGHLDKRVINEAGNVRYINVEEFKRTNIYCLVEVNIGGVEYSFHKP